MHKAYSSRIEGFSRTAAKWAGSEWGFLTALITLLLWFVAGTYMGFDTQWENLLSIYVGIITFMMLFVLQRAQNKELLAVHIKLNELLMATQNARNEFVKVEELTEREITLAHQTHETAVPR